MKQFLRFQISGMTFFLWLSVFYVSSNQNMRDALVDNFNLNTSYILIDKVDGASKIFNIDINKTKYVLSEIRPITLENNLSMAFSDKILINKSPKFDFGLVSGLVAIAVFFALPIGALIHQVSVMLKNTIGIFTKGKCFSDSPSYISQNFSTKCIRHYDADSCQEGTCEADNSYILEQISNLNSYYYTRVDNGALAPLLAYIILAVVFNVKIEEAAMYSALGLGFLVCIYIFRLCYEINVLKKLITCNNKFYVE